MKIEFIRMKETNKWMPISGKNITIITDDGETKRGFLPHWAECKYANDFRK